MLSVEKAGGLKNKTDSLMVSPVHTPQPPTAGQDTLWVALPEGGNMRKGPAEALDP